MINEFTKKILTAKIYADIKKDILNSPELDGCTDFSQVHDIVDGNCLGGLCDNHFIWGESFKDSEGGLSDTAVSMINNATTSIDQWLKDTRQPDTELNIKETRHNLAQIDIVFVWYHLAGDPEDPNDEGGEPLTHHLFGNRQSQIEIQNSMDNYGLYRNYQSPIIIDEIVR